MQPDVAIVGAGYVGMPLAKVFADAGKSVVLIDVDDAVVDGINRGESHIPDVPSGELKRLVDDERITVLENTRFNPGETKNDPEFARELADGCDLYVDDAFGSAHRAHASTAGMIQFFSQAAAGLLMNQELKYLGKATSDPDRPCVALLGGAVPEHFCDVQRGMLQRALLRNQGNVSAAARALGVDPSTLYRKRERYGLKG